MVIWFLVLTTVMNNGDVYSEIRPATKPEYNTEKVCMEVGAQIVLEEQMKVGVNNGKVYFNCNSISKEQFDSAVGAING